MTDGPQQVPQPRAVPAGARLTPYELVFGEAGFETRIFPSLVDEAEGNGDDPASRERFAFLTLAADALRGVIPTEAPREATEQHRALLYHSFNFWRFGRRLYLLEKPVARYLVEAAPGLDGWEMRLPHPSVYLQLPANLFWASISADVPPEPVDGFFVVQSRGTDPLGPPYHHFEVLMVLGIRRERAGFSIIPFDLEVGPGIADDWADAPGRDAGPDFASVLPGGEAAGLYSILTTGEALKLLARALWYIQAHPEDLVHEQPAERRTRDRPGTVALSRLAWCRVGFGGAASPGAPVDGPADSADSADSAGPADSADPARSADAADAADSAGSAGGDDSARGRAAGEGAGA
ncbi:MAG: hypothetical protein JWM27_4061 [Gemmatimonadetes bacterium]|nr:hypothetical protein [Gemmatimonadota bacterium]